jgi:hypothetical protein
MRMARQAPTSLTRRLVFELKAQGQDKSHHQFHKGLAVAKQLHVQPVSYDFALTWWIM